MKVRIEEANNDFDKIIENTTEEIESFLERSNNNSQI